MQPNELKTRVPTKRQIRRICRYFAKTKIQASELKRRVPDKTANSTNMADLANMANLTIFRPRPKSKRMSSRQGHQQSREFEW